MRTIEYLSVAASCLCALLAAAPVVAARPDSPIVAMRVIMPDGHMATLSTHKRGTATATLKDGTEFGFRPTIEDSAPWHDVVVTIFRMPTAAHAAEEIGSVHLKAGMKGVRSATQPAFTIAVDEVSAATS